jgi:preprotein translocase subunit SecY
MTVAQRRIPVQQAKHTRGRRVFGGQKSFLPLRINHGGVMPIIFASSLMVFPSILFGQLATLLQSKGMGRSWLSGIANFFTTNLTPGGYLYIILFIAMIYFFSYFWVTVQFNPEDMSKQLKESGSFIPGLRPGPRTAEYLETVINRVTYVGAGFLALVAIIPTVLNSAANIDWTVTQFFGGTGLLIVVSVVMDFLQKVEANLLMRNYAGFLSGGEEGRGGPRLGGPRG